MIEITGRAGKSTIIESLKKTSKTLVVSYDKSMPFADYIIDLGFILDVSEIIGNNDYDYFIVYINEYHQKLKVGEFSNLKNSIKDIENKYRDQIKYVIFVYQGIY
jgi:hypothetical protein